VGQVTGAVKCGLVLVSDLNLVGHGHHSDAPWLLCHSLQPLVTTLFSVDDQTVVSTSIVSLHLTIFAFSAEEIQIVATEDLMNAQIGGN
jgi:hypothetical protein